MIVQIMKKGKMMKTNDDNKKAKSSRFLITINVFGSAGPIRFVVSEDETTSGVIETALKLYAKEGRLPILGFDINSVFLYTSNAGFDALEPSDEIGSYGVRNFVLCKKQGKLARTEARSHLMDRKQSRWRDWLQKSFSKKQLIKVHVRKNIPLRIFGNKFGIM
ncbi:hypothetical protein CASFOL_015352 [Castilleja foliolosa]|uniref:DUF7054 domain-containing protein n=1 Tax=Castilleja foliolosa TaxID=1961234 RepID=A0ABD3DGW2_9LAMI